MFHDGEYKCLVAGAFDKSISNDIVEFWLEHDRSLVVGDSKSNLELYSDNHGLAFRLHLPDTEIGFQARDLAESKAFSAMSVGFDRGKAVFREVGGKRVAFIQEARLEEISLLKQGAIEKAHAILSDTKDCRSLREDCKSGQFLNDGAYVGVTRALMALDS